MSLQEDGEIQKEHHVKKAAEIRGKGSSYKLRNSKDFWEPPKLRTGLGFFSGVLREIIVL
jgi:hypothetical protein